MTFASPWILLGIPLFIFFFIIMRKKIQAPGFLFPSEERIKNFRGGTKLVLVKRIVYLRVLVILLIIFSMARPQVSKEKEIQKEGIGIILVMDTSSTMLADDVKLSLADISDERAKKGVKNLTRIDAVKEVAADFVKNRPDDMVGLVAFASEAFVVCPLTFDHDWLKQSIIRTDVGLIDDGTAIGSGILSGVSSLKDTKMKSKVMVLLTDGINNYGRTPPLIAAKAARALGIKIYTIGLAGGSGLQLADDGSGRRVYKGESIDVDEGEMKKIAKLTNGEYYRVTDMESLRKSYEEIDKLERTVIEEKGHEDYVDMFQYFLGAAFALLLLDIFLRNSILRRIP